MATRTSDPEGERAAAPRLGLRRRQSARLWQWAARSGIRRHSPAVQRGRRGELSPPRELAEFLALVYQTLPTPAALAYLLDLEPMEREAALHAYAAHLGDQETLPVLVHRRVSAVRAFIQPGAIQR